MKQNAFLVAAAVLLIATGKSGADTVAFDLRSTAKLYNGGTTSVEDVDESPLMVLNLGGITATLQVQPPTGGLFNQTTSAFGINAPGTGDVTDQLDGALGAESFTISFDVPVLLLSGRLTQAGASDSLSIVLPDSSFTVGQSNLSSNNFAVSLSNRIDVGESIRISHLSGGGISVDRFTVQVVPIPSAAAGGLALFGTFASRRRRG